MRRSCARALAAAALSAARAAQVCAAVCHAGHAQRAEGPGSPSPFYCDCGVRGCRAMRPVAERQLQEAAAGICVLASVCPCVLGLCVRRGVFVPLCARSLVRHACI